MRKEKVVGRWIGRLAIALALAVAPPAPANPPPRIGERLQARLETAASSDLIRIQVMLREDDLPKRGRARLDHVRARQDRALRSLPRGSFDVRRRYQSVSGMAGWATPEAIAELERHPEVERVYLDGRLQMLLGEGVPLVGADVVGAQGYTGEGINVAVLDSGIDTNHPFLVDDLVSEQCFCDDDPGVGIGCCPAGGETQSGAGAAEDDDGHGTGMSGVITSSLAGRTGVAPDAGIVAVRVLSAAGGGNFSDVDAGLDWVLTNHIALGIRVVNMSLGDGGEYDNGAAFPCTGSITQVAVTNLVNAGVVVFAASGNDGHDNGISVPGCIPDVISVGGVYDFPISSATWCFNPPTCTQTCQDNPASQDSFVCHTNDGSLLDLLAPNWNTRTLGLGGIQATLGGTSVSSAYAAGQAALLLSLDPTLTAASIRTLMTSNGPLVTNPDNAANYPRTDLFAAFSEVLLTLDTDADGILDDGDASGTIGDGPCSGGATVSCDDNCVTIPNPLQEDFDFDGKGNLCDAVIRTPSLGGFAAGLLAGALLGGGFAALRRRGSQALRR